MLHINNDFATYLGFFNLHGQDFIWIFLVILLLFGGKRLPELARSIGRSMREFRSAASEAENTFKSAMEGTDEDEKNKDKEKKQDETAGDSKTSNKIVSAQSH